MKRGCFLVLEGPDGCGTTFHSHALAERLRQERHRVLLTAEPTDGPIGREIRRYLSLHTPLPSEALQLLFTADRALHLAETVEPALAEGTIVISDRYVPSTLAYGEAAGVDSAWLSELNKNFIQPAATLYLLPPLSLCLERLAKRKVRDALESTPFQKRVYAVYERLAREDRRGAVLDTSGPKEDVTEQVYQAILAQVTLPVCPHASSSAKNLPRYSLPLSSQRSRN